MEIKARSSSLFAFLICLTLSMSISPVFAVVPITAQNDGSLSDLLDLQNSTGSNLAWVDSSGVIRSIKGLNSTGQFTINQLTTNTPHQPSTTFFGEYHEGSIGNPNIDLMQFGSGQFPIIHFFEALGTAAHPTVVTSGTGLGSINWHGFQGGSGVGGGYLNFTAYKARISVYADETWNTTANGVHIGFWTTKKGTTTGNEAFRIDDNGTLQVWNPTFTYPYFIIPNSITAPRSLNLPLLTKTETLAVQPQFNSTSGQLSGNATATSSTTAPKMAGVYATLTPSVTGRVMITVSGYGILSADTYCRIDIRESTTNMGANGASAGGTVIGNNIRFESSTSNQEAFSRTVDVTGLTVGTKYFFDLTEETHTGGSCGYDNVWWEIHEY